MSRILKPRGTLLFSIPNYWFINSILHGDILKGKRHFTSIKKGAGDTLSTIHLSMSDRRRVGKVFPYVKVRGRVALQHLNKPNWKDKVLALVPFIDKTLYFFCRKA